ncbi:MAG: sirohydrochlorin chelatase [Planctomycetes bacterium]|nr:sirohydrochlorin chelatase [Planctomycetota bacterium]
MNPSVIERWGILLVGHGTRDPRGQAQFMELAGRLAARYPVTPLAACYLELVEPGVDEAVGRLVAQGVERVVAVPVMLFAAGHVLRDIPAAVRVALENHPRVSLAMTDALGCDPRLVELSRRRFDEAVAAAPPVAPPEQTMLLLVGRGSSDLAAQAELARFAALRRERLPSVDVEVCYVAAARPTLDEGLARAAQSPCAIVVVQPHLLFAGQVLDTVAEAVRRMADDCPGKRWLLAEPLGPESLIVEALAAQVDAVTLRTTKVESPR